MHELAANSALGQPSMINSTPTRQPSTSSGRYWICLSLRLTARVIWPRSAAARLPISRLTSDQMPLRVQVR